VRHEDVSNSEEQLGITTQAYNEEGTVPNDNPSNDLMI
jgi:hypothetical protein